MLQFEWAAEGFDMDRDTRVVHAADGALAAFAQHSTPDPGLLRYDAYGPVDPAFEGRGLGSAIIDWTEAQTRCPDRRGLDRSTVALGTGRQRGRDRAARTVRLRRIRSFWQMAMDLDGSFDAGPVPEGVTIRPVVMEVDGPAAQSVVEHGVPIALRPRGGDVRRVAGAAGGRRHLGSHARTARRGRRDDRRLQQQRGDRRGRLRVRARRAAGDAGQRDREGPATAFLRDAGGAWDPKGRLGVDTQNVTGAVELYRSVGLIPVSERRVVEKLIAAD